jgi:hypothetical protein
MKQLIIGLSSILLGISGQSQEKTLDISPIFQQTSEWCWVTCGEMVFRYYDICPINPINFQCGIIALIAPQCNQNCFSCALPAGSTQVVINMLYTYPLYAHSMCGSSKVHIICQNVFGECEASAILEDIDNDMPLIAGISPAGGGTVDEAAHVVLIIGYSKEDEETYLIINDPFPYSLYGMRDPYTFYQGELLERGQYKIKYSTFRRNFAWNRTLRSIR